MKILGPVFLLLFVGCGSVKSKQDLAPHCGDKSGTRIGDLQRFGFQPVTGKVGVTRVFATWCPYCKTDLDKISTLFKAGTWQAKNIELYLLAYANSRETHATFKEFINERLPKYDIPREAVQVVFVDKPHSEMIKSMSASGQPLFAGWSGVPFGLVFGKDGRLVFRGHFTASDQGQTNHYKMITDLQSEDCSAMAAQ